MTTNENGCEWALEREVPYAREPFWKAITVSEH